MANQMEKTIEHEMGTADSVYAGFCPSLVCL